MAAHAYRLLAFDLDGTLLRSDQTLSSETVAVLHRCRAQDMRIAFVTARSNHSAARYAKLFPADAVITSGGAQVRMGADVIATAFIPAAMADSLIAQALRMPAVKQVSFAGEHRYLSNRLSLDPTLTHYRYNAFDGPLRENAFKVTLISADTQAIAQLAAQFPLCTFTSYTGEDMHAFSSMYATKAHALQTLAAHMGIPMASIAAFGNDENDVCMLAACGMGVAVANAVPALKAVARAVCASNDEDGVAHWITAQLLPKLSQSSASGAT